MKFEQLLNHFDMGICVEQLQKESLLDIALLFVSIDGKIETEEMNIVRDWAKTLRWNSAISLQDYMDDALGKCLVAIKQEQTESYIQHRLSHIVDKPMRELAVSIAHKISEANGEVCDSEKRALAMLENEI
ncbi:hypothetical protein [Pseudoalteromonas sp. R3]|uniref:hypothetical protein n=1 Tax=Pseudoalteromonas sp. R3 TaxID=1709477 RepID=UPI0006B532D9|nr:hypothetical protein [Pseudoalteromonas sp. R3]AZZ97769.1 hypothetical protein ELR70_11970 [Pseudoalteromonas sp. R3]